MTTVAAANCTALAILLGALPWAQAADHVGSSPSAVIPADAAGRATVLNQDFAYPGIELWDPAKWPVEPVKPILAWIETHQTDTHPEYVVPAKYQGIGDFVGNPDYTWKSNNITDKDVTDGLARMGLRVEMRESETGRNLSVVVTPEKVLADKQHKYPLLIVPYVVDKRDVFWAMNALLHFKKYNELCAQRGDFIISYAVVDKSVAGLYSLGSTAGAGDPKRLYLDMSVFAQNGAKVAAVPGLNWSDDNGAKSDPDASIEHIGFIPVLNIAGKSTTKAVYGQPGIRSPVAVAGFDPQLVIHGMVGKHWMEGIGFLHSHGKDSDPAIKAHFEEMGLVGGEHDFRGKRYFLYSPRQAVERGTKLPLVVLNSTVSYANPYSISAVYASFLDYFNLAASGEMNILAVGLGTPTADAAGDSKEAFDLDADLIREVEKTNPIDPSRVYVTGHSHLGMQTRELAYQHPEIIAAAAPLGNSSGLAAPAYSHESPVATDQRIDAWSKIDMPLITIGAAGEELSPHTIPQYIIPDYDLFIDAWQRRLKASRAPMKTKAEIMAAEHSSDYVTRLYGLPNDGSSLQVIDGVEHYVIDIKNIDGKNHLRFVAVQNMIHTTEPTMPMVAWSWMRRFARDQNTGEVIELY
jgi:hypothetical protein